MTQLRRNTATSYEPSRAQPCTAQPTRVGSKCGKQFKKGGESCGTREEDVVQFQVAVDDPRLLAVQVGQALAELQGPARSVRVGVDDLHVGHVTQREGDQRKQSTGFES